MGQSLEDKDSPHKLVYSSQRVIGRKEKKGMGEKGRNASAMWTPWQHPYYHFTSPKAMIITKYLAIKLSKAWSWLGIIKFN